MNDHAFTVDIGDLEVAQFGSAQTGCVQHHQHGAVHSVLSGINEPRHLFLTQYRSDCGRLTQHLATKE